MKPYLGAGYGYVGAAQQEERKDEGKKKEAATISPSPSRKKQIVFGWMGKTHLKGGPRFFWAGAA
jgi:hypothetical protein